MSNKTNIMIILLVSIPCFFALLLIDRWQVEDWRGEKNKELEAAATMIQTRLTGAFESRFNAIKAIASLFIIHPETNRAGFGEFSAQLLRSNLSIRALQYADRQTKVTYVYPPEGNEITISRPMHLLSDPKRGPFVKKAIDQKRPILQGPFNLRQGGLGVVVRDPIFKGDEFIGLAIGVFDVPALLEEALSGTALNGYIIRLSDQSGRIFKGPDKELPGVIKKTVVAADARWVLSVSLKKAAQNPPGATRILIWAFGLAFLIISAFLIRHSWRQANVLEMKVSERTSEIKDREERIRLLLNSTAEAIFGLDKNGRCTFCNPACLRLLGLESEAEMLGQPVHDVFHHTRMDGRSFPLGECPTQAALIQERNFHIDDEIFWRKDGSSFPVEYWAYPVRENGEVTSSVVTFIDITERKAAEQELLATKEIFEKTFQGQKDAIFILDADSPSHIIDVNQAAGDMFGYSVDEMLGKTITFLYISQRHEQRFQEKLLASLKKHGYYENDDYEMIRSDGRIFSTHLYVLPLINDQGDRFGWVAVIRDISEQKKAKNDLLDSEKNYRLLAENPNSIVIKFDAEGRIDFVNQYAADLFGYSREEMHGKTAVELILDKTDSVGRSSEELFESILNNPEKYKLHENENITRDGRRLWISWANTPIYDDGGGLASLISTGFDATERKKAEEELRESENRFRAVVENINAAIYVVQNDRYVYSNLTGGLLVGSSPENVLGRHITEFVPPDEMPRIKERHRRRLEGQVVDDIIEHKLKTVDGGTRWIQTGGTSITWHGAYSTLAFAVDVTAQKEAEADKERLENQLRQAQKMEALGTLAGGIAHDFNNILGAIIGYSELAVDDVESGVLDPKPMREVIRAGHRAKDLVTRILSFSRKLEPELKPADLNKVVLEAENMLRRVLPRMIEIEHVLADDLWLTKADVTQISQVLMNLGANAKDAMPDGGRLVIETGNLVLDEDSCAQQAGAAPGEYVKVVVSDTGHGMNRETQAHMFDPFFTSKEVGKGTGLGLATVYGIIKTHSGFITCQSEPGRGTAFTIYLPALRANAPIKVSAKQTVETIPGGNETILLVDDDESLRNLGSRILTRQGYNVLTAETGEAALDIYLEQGTDIDLIVLDVSMPGMGGHKCLKELRRINPGAKVVISSGYSLDGQLKDIMADGAAGFVAKPFSKAEIVETVRDVLDQ